MNYDISLFFKNYIISPVFFLKIQICKNNYPFANRIRHMIDRSVAWIGGPEYGAVPNLSHHFSIQFYSCLLPCLVWTFRNCMPRVKKSLPLPN